MKGEKLSVKAAHRALGVWCKRCAEYADVVAIYQHGPSKGHPLGREELIPMCARHGRLAIGQDVPRPRLVEHAAAVDRAAKADRDRRRGGQGPQLKLKAGSVTGGDRHD